MPRLKARTKRTTHELPTPVNLTRSQHRRQVTFSWLALSRRRHRLLRGEIVLDEGLDDLVDAGIGANAQAPGALRHDGARPAGDDLLDDGVGLPAEAFHRPLAAGPPQRLDHLRDIGRDARQ